MKVNREDITKSLYYNGVEIARIVEDEIWDYKEFYISGFEDEALKKVSFDVFSKFVKDMAFSYILLGDEEIHKYQEFAMEIV